MVVLLKKETNQGTEAGKLLQAGLPEGHEIPEFLLARGRKARVCDYDSRIARARRVHDLLEVTIARGTNHQTSTRSTSLLIDACSATIRVTRVGVVLV
jgi:hypothetical protein